MQRTRPRNIVAQVVFERYHRKIIIVIMGTTMIIISLIIRCIEEQEKGLDISHKSHLFLESVKVDAIDLVHKFVDQRTCDKFLVSNVFDANICLDARGGIGTTSAQRLNPSTSGQGGIRK